MDPARQHLPAEHPQPQEGGLQEERGETLHRQRSAEDVADVQGIRRPVHAELELLHQTRDDADRDVDQQQRPEEAGQPLVPDLARTDTTWCEGWP